MASASPSSRPSPTRPPSDEIARRPESFTGAYHSGPFNAFANAGLFFASRVADTLDHTATPSIAYVAALNHQLIGPLGEEPLFHSNMAIVDGIFAGHTFAYRNYHAALPDDALFRDTEHLTEAGMVQMVRLLLDDNRALLDRVLGKR